jgi:diacylglycerol O-acyltransferase / wax synthase
LRTGDDYRMRCSVVSVDPSGGAGRERYDSAGVVGKGLAVAVGRASGRIERLGAADLMLVWPEAMGWPQDIGALAVLDGGSVTDSDGRFPIEKVRERIGERLHLVPRFRQLLFWPRTGLGWPVWVDARSFDIDDHVGVAPVAPPSDETQLLRVCEELRRRPLDRSRPLWEMWFLPGLADRRIGLFIRLHHAIADGIAGVATLSAFVDVVPDPPDTPAPGWTPAPMPSGRDLLADNVRRRFEGVRRALAALAHPATALDRLGRSWPAIRELFAEGRAPRTSVNRRIGSDRRLAVIRSKLDLAKEIAHAQGATVNDVLLTAVAGGYRALLQSRGEQVDGLVLRAFVPVSLHQEQAGQARGNVDAGMVVPLPIGEPDEVRRLERIAGETAVRKRRSRPPAGSLFRSVLLQRAFLRLMPRQRFMNAYVANVPGPPVPLFMAGAPMLELFPLVPITANISIGVGALSYAGQFNITVVADQQLCPDLEIFVDGVRRSLDRLGRAVPTLGGRR